MLYMDKLIVQNSLMEKKLKILKVLVHGQTERRTDRRKTDKLWEKLILAFGAGELKMK